MDSNVLIAFMGVAGTIGGVYLGYHLNKKSMKEAQQLIDRQSFNKAAAEFETAFTEEMIAIERSTTQVPNNIIMNAIAKHRNAMIRFRHFVAKDSKSLFDMAWRNYENYEQYRIQSNDPNELKAKRQFALDNMTNLLDFVKHD